MVRDSTLPAIASLGFQPVDEVDDVEEAAAGTVTDAAAGNGDGQMRLSGPGAADQDGVTLLSREAPTGEIAHQSRVDRRALELEVAEILGQRQLGDAGI